MWVFELVTGDWMRYTEVQGQVQVQVQAQVGVHIHVQVQVVGLGQRKSLEEGTEVERQVVWMERWRQDKDKDKERKQKVVMEQGGRKED